MPILKERNETIDIIKGIGIFLMVLRHARFPHSDVVLLFHMAVFFIASGYLYKPFDRSTRILSFIWRKIKSLWVPYFITNFVFVLSNNLFLKFGIYSCNGKQEMNEFAFSEYFTMKDYVKSLVKAFCFQLNTHMGGATWFYGTLFGVLVFYAVIDCIVLYKGSSFNTTAVRVGVASIFSIFGWMCMLTGHSLRGLDRVFTVYPLIEIGRFFKNYNLLVAMKSSRRLQAASISIIILAIGYRFGNIALVNNRIVNPFFFLLMSIAGWFVLLYISDIIMKYTHIKSICELFSKRSIWIIGGHFLAFKIVTKIQIIVMEIEPFKLAAFPVLIEGYFWSTLYTIIGLLFPLLIGLAVDKFLLKEMHRVY